MAYVGKLTIQNIHAALKLILNHIARPIWVEPGTARVKATLESAAITMTGVTTVTTVTTVTNVTQFSGFGLKDTLLNHQKKQIWQLAVRNRIT